jgi:hypothetical protein
MSFSFNTYESFGRCLKDSSKEVELRNSVSRGYYCFYHKVKRFFGYTVFQYVRHEDLIAKLNSDYRLKHGAKLSNAMQNLKEDREDADYKVVPRNEFNNKNVEYFWKRYDKTIELLKEEELN